MKEYLKKDGNTKEKVVWKIQAVPIYQKEML